MLLQKSEQFLKSAHGYLEMSQWEHSNDQPIP